MTTEPQIARLAAVDVETTHVDPRRLRIWEIAWALAEHNAEHGTLTITDRQTALVQVDPQGMAAASPRSLQVGRYYERGTDAVGAPRTSRAQQQIARRFAHASAGRQLVGINPAFDARAIDDLMRAHGTAPAWDYHLIDVLPLAAATLTERAQALTREVQAIHRNGGDPATLADRANSWTRLAAPPWKSDQLLGPDGLGLDVDDRRHEAAGDVDLALHAYASCYRLELRDAHAAAVDADAIDLSRLEGADQGDGDRRGTWQA